MIMSIRLNIAGTIRQATHADTLLGAPLAYTDVTGGHVAYDYDRHGRLSHLRDGELTAELRYDALGRLRSQTARNPATGDALTTDVSYDDIGREVQRTLTDSAGAVVTLTQTWRANGQLASRSTLHDGVLVRDEAFTYDLRSRLVRHTADGSHLPQDTYGRDMTAQTFTYDPFNNLLRCVTSLADGTGDDATFLYGNPDDPDQLTAVTHTHPDYPALITLAYDANGRMTRDEAGRILEYDALGRLLSVRIDEDGAAGSYGYDALGRLTFQQPAGDDASRLFYRGDDLVNELRDDRATRLLRLGSDCLGGSADGSLTLTGTHAHDSPLWSRTAGEDEGTHHAWSAYGAGNAGDDLPGFNGERRDPVSGAYHLGNGYRAYSPALMRFTCPDSLSPFGAGGINPYAYCLGDPVNHTDPSGHVSNAGWVSIGLGIAGLIMTAGMAAPAIVAAGSVSAALASASAFALTVGTATVISDVAAIASGAMDKGDPETSSVLGWISLATGIVSMGSTALRGFAQATSGLRQRLGRIRTIGLNGYRTNESKYWEVAQNYSFNGAARTVEFDILQYKLDVAEFIETYKTRVSRPIPSSFKRRFGNARRTGRLDEFSPEIFNEKLLWKHNPFGSGLPATSPLAFPEIIPGFLNIMPFNGHEQNMLNSLLSRVSGMATKPPHEIHNIIKGMSSRPPSYNEVSGLPTFESLFDSTRL